MKLLGPGNGPQRPKTTKDRNDEKLVKDVIMKLAQKANYNLVGQPGDKLVDGMMQGTLGSGAAAQSSGWFR